MNRLPSLFSNWHNLTNIQACLQLRSIHLTGINCDIIWRRNRRLPKNPSSSGPLTDLPDYTFMDGRPTPLGTRQLGRLERQRGIAKKIVQGIFEVDFGKQEYKRKLAAEEQERQNILDSKLIPKGRLLNKKE